MFEAAAMCCVVASFATLHAVSAPSSPLRRRRETLRPFVRVVALVLVSAAFWLWNQADPGPAAWLGPFAALQAAAAFVVLLSPLWPRLVWLLALGSVPLALAFACLGAQR